MITDEDKNLLLQQYYDRGILKKEIRSYEVSLWTLQDDFITVLKWSDVEQKGRIENPKMTLNTDGTQKLTFSIPMYYRVNGDLVENPNWYNTQNNNLITGLRKIKVIFNKTTEFKEVFEFLIINVKESHEKDILTCEVECEGLAFQELGKIGYNISLSPENFLLEYNEWAKTQDGEEPLQNVQYWCEAAGLEPYPGDGVNINSRKWYYDIQMNWQSFSDAPNRQSNIVYEEPYTSSWNDNLVPAATEQYRQKCRPITIDKSNLYNITQTIAETFEIFCRYEYKYDENNHIVGKIVVFYNNFMKENQGYLSFKYPYDLSQVTRMMDSTAVTTKLFILNPEDADITTAEVNPSKENYILNFDYLYQINAINKEQYDRILPYQQEMRVLNKEIIDLQQQIAAYETQIIEYKAKQTVAKNSIALDKEQVHQNSALLNSLDTKDAEEDGLITISGANADYFILIPKEDGTQYINLANTNKGIKEDTIEIFTTITYTDKGALLANKITGYQLVHDTNDYEHLIGITLTDKTQLQNITKIDWAKVFKDYYIPANYKGNVDLSHRIIVPAQSFISAGYEFDGAYGTLFSGSFTPMGDNNTPKSSDGKYYDIIYTPITAKGVVLSETKINEYLDSIIAAGSTPQEWMAADQKKDKMLLHYVELSNINDHTAADNWATNLHNLQEEWDKIRAANNWMGYDSNPNKITFGAPTYPQGFDISKYSTTEQITKVYLTYKYDPQLYYQPIIDTWKAKQSEDEKSYRDLTRMLGPESIDDEEYDMDVFDGTNITTKEQAYNQGLNKKLKDTQDNLNNVKLPEKKKKIQDFEHLMGPALREGYWQPEDYKDYGDRHEYNGTISNGDITADAGKDAIIAWDAKLFDTEDKLYYESGILQDKIYYPCIDLLAVFGNNIPNDLYKYSVVWKNTNIDGYQYNWDSLKDIRQCAVGSQALIKFIKYNNVIKPVLMIKGAQSLTDDELTRLTSTGNARLEIFSTTVTNEGEVEVSHGQQQYSIGNNWIIIPKNTSEDQTPIVYPRIKFSSMDLRANTTDLVIHYNNILLQQFNDYSVLTRNTERSGKYYSEYYITIQPEIFIKYGLGQSFKINYIFSNANTSIYLDAIKVSKENAYPKASYEVSVNMLNINILNNLYTYLARIVMINDTDLKFENVFGYISGLELDLDNYSNDKIEVKNYKTKFEDLFSTIVAQTEAMKQSGAGLTTALSGGIPLSEGGFNETLLQHTSILNAYLDSYFDSSQVVKDRLAELFTEASDILATGKKSLNSMTSLTSKNASILAGFAENVAEELSTKVHRSETRPDKFDAGDIWIQVDQNGNEIGRYMAIMSSYQLPSESKNSTRGFVRTYDGTLASIKGASLDIDAETGIINIEAQSYLNIKSGKNVYIAANEKVDIVGNKQVNIGGTEINICAVREMNVQEDGTLTSSDTVQSAGSINLIAGALTSINDASVSKILIKPDKIEMGAAELLLKASSTINLIASTGQPSNTSAISIDADHGVWIGSGAGIRIFSGNVSINNNGTINTTSGANIELNSEHLILGFSMGAGAQAIEMKKEYLIIAAGDIINSNSEKKSNGITGTSSGLVGAKFTKDSIGFATQSGSGNNIIYNAFIMNNKGLTLGSSKGNINLAQSTNEQLRSHFATTSNGSFVRIAPEGIELGSLADLYINTDNFKLQTHSRDKGNTGYENGDTILAVGRGLQSVDYNTTPAQISELDDKNGVDVRLVLNKAGVYLKGTVYASAGKFTGDIVANSFILNDNSFRLPISQVTDLSTTLANQTKSTVAIYYLTTSTTAPNKPTAEVSTLSTTSLNTWALTYPRYPTNAGSTQYYYYSCIQSKTEGGVLSWTDPKRDYGITYAAQYATSASIDADNARAITDAFTANGLLTNYWWPEGTGDNHTGGQEWKVALVSTENLLIGANSTLWVAKSAAYNDGAALVIDHSGIAMNGATINIKAQASDSTNVITLNSTGISIGSTGKLEIGTNNFILNSSATNSNSILELKAPISSNDNTLESKLKFTQNEGLTIKGAITATSFILSQASDYTSSSVWRTETTKSTPYNSTSDTSSVTWSSSMPNLSQHKGEYLHTKKTTTLGGQSTITYEVSYIAQDGSSGSATLPPWTDGLTSGSYNNNTIPAVQLSSSYALVLGAGIGIFAPKLNNGSLDDTYLKITSGEIALDYDSNNYIHMSSAGIELKGKHLLINGQKEWSRDDIIVMKRSGATGYEDQTTIENRMRNAGRTDWVLIKPYYDALINYEPMVDPIFVEQTTVNAGPVSGYTCAQTDNLQLAFGDNSTYTYTFSCYGNSSSFSSASDSQALLIRLIASNGTDEQSVDLSNNSNAEPYPYTWTGTLPAQGQNAVKITSESGQVSTNLCKEGYRLTLYIGYIRGNGTVFAPRLRNITITCTADATISKVPCTVYYYP